NENLRNVDPDRTNLVAGSTERTGVGKTARVLHLLKLRREDGADGTRVNAAVSVAAGLPIDWADILARSATNAVQCLAALAVCKYAGSRIVHQDDMKGARAVVFVDAGPDGVVRIHALAGGTAREELKEDLQVTEAGNHFVDSGDSDQRAWQREAHAAIAFALDDADAARLGDEKVCTANGGWYAQEFFTKKEPCGFSEIFR